MSFEDAGAFPVAYISSHVALRWQGRLEPGETLPLSSAQLSKLIDGVDWRAPERQWRPAVAG